MNLMELAVKITADDQASSKIESISGSTSSSLSKAANVGKTAVVAAAAAAGTALVALGKSALDAYATYEQVTGGVETLFGTSADTVKAYAAQAYQTAGLSANAYMEQATSFSASLISSLGGDTAAAAEYANRAIIDMSDNANKMGTDISLIQNAYQGFAKQNYTMLDNLKLGFGGTQEEAMRLVNEASQMTEEMEELGLTVEEDSLDFGNLVNAISVMQKHMGIAGTTTAEAMHTIEGSINMTKAAWTNWVTGLADDSADMQKLTSQLVESATAAASNILPRLKVIFQAIVTELPAVVSQLSPVLIQALTELLPAIAALVPQFLEAAMDLFIQLLNALIEVAPQIVEMLPEMIVQFCSVLLENLPLLLEAALTLFLAIATAFLEALPQIIAMLPQLIEQAVPTLISMIPALLAAGVTLFMAIATAVPQILGALLSAIGQLISDGIGHVGDFIGDMADAGWQLIQGLVNGILSAPGAVADAVCSAVGGAISAAKSMLGIASPSKVFRAIGEYSTEGLEEGILSTAESPVRAMRNVANSVIEAGSIDVSARYKAADSASNGRIYNITMNVTADSSTTLESLIRQAERAGMAYGR